MLTEARDQCLFLNLLLGLNCWGQLPGTSGLPLAQRSAEGRSAEAARERGSAKCLLQLCK